MWLVNFANDNYVEFYAIDIEELILLIVEYTNNDRKYFEKAMSGFKKRSRQREPIYCSF